MNEALAKFMTQKGKNITLLIICGTAVALFHKEAAVAVMSAVALAVGAPAVAEKWPADSTGETK
jgi:hypothetical protein